MSNASFLAEVFAPEAQRAQENKFERYGLLHNPFPGREQEFHSFVFGQSQAKDQLRLRMEQFVADGRISSVVVEADHRVGKTNFLKHYNSKLTQVFDTTLQPNSTGPRLLPFYTNVYEYDFFFLYSRVVDRIPEGLLYALGDGLKDESLPLDSPETELAHALRKMGREWSTAGFDDGQRWERVRVLQRWLRGGFRSLTKAEREVLGVRDNISNTPVGSRFLRDLMNLLRSRELLGGIVLFLDEFERLVGAGVSRGQQDRYLNDVRNFISDFQQGAFFCFAITPAALQELHQIYPALPPRLGTSLPLLGLRTETEAVQFAREYEKWFRKQAEVQIPALKKPVAGWPELIGDAIIGHVYLRLRDRFGPSVPQGHFLAGLRDQVETLV